ncbi:MAG: transcription elongation factor GreA [Ruminococcaceae bacterium]|nr:transcription elongation factor GreA [Oscillospiraceae bacterium]
MQNKEVVVTYAGLTKLEAELNQLKTVRRKEVADKIKVARGYGDLSENSEYDEAKNEQGIIESRIAELEAMLKNIRVIDEDELTNEHVMVGSHVLLRDADGDEEAYDIVGSTEADPANGRISDESPVGAALLNHGVGDMVEVTVPSGATISYQILEISKSAL